jgi:ADP-ribose pyrophosphatase YjhB (NUDIX family)
MTHRVRLYTDDGIFGARGVGIMIRNDRVLLCRLLDEDVWVLPGGGIYLHETAAEAAKREFMEEAGFEVEVHRLLCVLENFFVYQQTGERIHGYGFYFLVTPRASEGKWSQEEFRGQEEYWDIQPGEWKVIPGKSQPLLFKWFATDELDDLNFQPAILKEILKELPENVVHLVMDRIDPNHSRC